MTKPEMKSEESIDTYRLLEVAPVTLLLIAANERKLFTAMASPFQPQNLIWTKCSVYFSTKLKSVSPYTHRFVYNPGFCSLSSSLFEMQHARRFGS